MKEKIIDVTISVLAYSILAALMLPIVALFLVGVFFTVLVVPLEFCFGWLMNALQVKKSQQKLVYYGFFKAATWPIMLSMYCCCALFCDGEEFQDEWEDAKRTLGWG